MKAGIRPFEGLTICDVRKDVTRAFTGAFQNALYSAPEIFWPGRSLDARDIRCGEVVRDDALFAVRQAATGLGALGRFLLREELARAVLDWSLERRGRSIFPRALEVWVALRGVRHNIATFVLGLAGSRHRRYCGHGDHGYEHAYSCEKPFAHSQPPVILSSLLLGLRQTAVHEHLL